MFHKVPGIGRNDDIWPEMGPWGVLESFCTSIRYFSAFRSIFMKFQKMPFLTLWIMIYGHFRVGRIFNGSKIGQPISAKAKTHLDPFPKIPSLKRFTFLYQKNQFFGHFTKISVFGEVLLLLLFGVPRCCFLKSMVFQLSFAQNIILISLLDQKLCQFEIWSIPCILVIFDVIMCVYVRT